MRIVKCAWSSISTGQEATEFIRALVKRAHTLRKRAHQLCKAAILRSYEREQEHLVLEGEDLNELFRFATRVIGAKTLNCDKFVPRNELEGDLLHAYYATCHGKAFAYVSNDGLAANWLNREAASYVDSIERHVKENYQDCMCRCMGPLIGLPQGDRAEVVRVIQSIALGQAEEHLIPELHEHARRMLPCDGLPLEKDYAFYDVNVSPLRYIPCMIYMCRLIEEGDGKVYAVLPLVSSHVPGSIFLDTQDLLGLMPKTILRCRNITKQALRNASYMPVTEQPLEQQPVSDDEQPLDGNDEQPVQRRGKRKRADYTDAAWSAGQVEVWKGKYAIWSCILDLKKRVFRSTLAPGHPPNANDWRFNALLTTDGYSASIYFEKKHHQEARAINSKAYERPDVLKLHEELERPNAPTILRVVSIDPGKNNLIFAYNGDVQYDEGERKLRSKGGTFRYTKKQRKYETKAHVFRHLLQVESNKDNSANHPVPSSQLSTVSAWNALLGENGTLRTSSSEVFEWRLNAALEHEAAVNAFYLKAWHRKRRFQAYQLQQKSEAKMVRTFKERMGIVTSSDKQHTLIAFGSGARCNLRNQESVPSIGIARLLLRNKLRVAIADERYTSKRCYHCATPTAETKANVVEYMAPNGSLKKVWGLCKCQTCHRFWSRDFHAALNIHRLATCEVRGEQRPVYLSQTNHGTTQPGTVNNLQNEAEEMVIHHLEG